MNKEVTNIFEYQLEKACGIKLYSYQEIKDMNITFSPEDQLNETMVYEIVSRIEDNEPLYSILTLKKQGEKIVVIEGRHIIQAINEVKKHCDDWYKKVIPVKFYQNGEIL